MTRRLSNMGASKYEFATDNQLDVDIRANEARYHYRYKYIEQIIQKIMWQEPARQAETMEMFIKVLRGMREE